MELIAVCWIEFEFAHKLLMNLNIIFSKSMNLDSKIGKN